MRDVLSYHVYLAREAKWLGDDEKRWTSDFLESAAFTNPDQAEAIANRECGAEPHYVMACMGLR